MNLHGSTIPSYTLALPLAMLVFHVSSATYLIVFLFVTILSFIVAIAALNRFFVNLKKYKQTFCCPNNKLINK